MVLNIKQQESLKPKPKIDDVIKHTQNKALSQKIQKIQIARIFAMFYI